MPVRGTFPSHLVNIHPQNTRLTFYDSFHDWLNESTQGNGVATSNEIKRFNFLPTRCMLCESSAARHWYVITKYKQGDLHFVKCNGCETIYQNPMPDQESMQQFYNSQNFFNCTATADELTGYRDYDGEEYTRNKNAEKRLNELEQLYSAQRKLRILKVACGYGALVKLAKDRGHEAQGIDFSDAMLDGARKRYGLELIHADFLQYDFGAQRFDMVVLYGAINNFLRPLDVARKALSILEPGGFYVVNHVWPGSFPEMLLRSRYWIYRPPIIGLYPKRAFQTYHVKLGFEHHRSQYDVQYLTGDKLFGYLQIRPFLNVINKLGFSQLGCTIPIPGYAREFFRKPT